MRDRPPEDNKVLAIGVIRLCKRDVVGNRDYVAFKKHYVQ